MPTILGANQLDTGYEIANSARFDNTGGDALGGTFGTPTNAKKFTLSMWHKLCSGTTSGGQVLFGVRGGQENIFLHESTMRMDWGNASSGTINWSPFIRDQSAWYHFVLAQDTSQSTSSNRIKFYINGVQITTLRSGVTATYPNQNLETGYNVNGVAYYVSSYNGSAAEVNAYLANVQFVDGQQYDPTYFGKFDDNGMWIPVEPGTGDGGTVDYGNNGFLLEFKQTGTGTDANGIGADTSGNDNHLAVTNLTSGNITVDTPTNNFSTLRFHGFPSAKGTITEGNLIWDTTGDGSDSARDLRQQAISNIGVASGKWYAEFKHTEDQNGLFIGVSNMSNKIHTDEIESYAYVFSDNGNLYRREYTGQSESNSAHGGGSNSLNDIYMIALDMDNTNVYFGKNGQWADGSGNWNQSNPTSAYSISTNFINKNSHGVIVFNCSGAGSSETPAVEANFGNPTFSISSGNADANGYGNFEYAPPSGYYSLCTKNLAQYG